MAVVEHLKIVYFPLLMMVKGIADAYQIHKELGVQLKLIQKAKCKYGLDVTITAEKIMVNMNYIFLFISLPNYNIYLSYRPLPICDL